MVGKKNERQDVIVFKPGDFVVYPTHGVGRVTGIEKETIAGHSLKLVVVTFDTDRMTLRVPIDKMETSGLRRVSSRKKMDDAVSTLKGRARIKRTMWSRRAQEYEAKINSGDPLLILLLYSRFPVYLFERLWRCKLVDLHFMQF